MKTPPEATSLVCPPVHGATRLEPLESTPFCVPLRLGRWPHVIARRGRACAPRNI